MKNIFCVTTLIQFALLLSACARTSSLPLAADTIELTTYAAPICGPDGATKVVTKMASIETIKHGYDKFIIIGSQQQNNVGVVGYTPVSAHTTYGGGIANTQVYGGAPIIAGTHDHGVVIKMFKDDDRSGANAISARMILGEKWREVVNSPQNTCID